MEKFKLTYILSILLLLLVGCGVVKNVPKGRFLLKKNEIQFNGDKFNEEEINEIIRQQPNTKSLGFHFKLWVFNHLDSSKIANKRIRIDAKNRKVNLKRSEKQNAINTQRILKAKSKGKEFYSKKTITLRDTIDPKLFLREWAKYKLGEVPVVFDSIVFNKSLDQLNAFLKTKGYFNGKSSGLVIYKKHQKAKVKYTITSNRLYLIDSLNVICSNEEVLSYYRTYTKASDANNLKGKPFDTDYLDDYRYNIARFMRDNALYGFSPSHITFEADTFSVKNKVLLKIYFTERQLHSTEKRDSLITKKFAETRVNEVYFHIADTTLFEGNFKSKVEELGLNVMNQNYVTTLDTFRYEKLKLHKSDSLDIRRIANFLYNGNLFLQPSLIEVQNYLEKGSQYTDVSLDKSYSYLQQMGLFQSVKVVIEEVPNSNLIDVHYYLVPSKKQNFSFVPRATNSNGYLGVTSSINYINKNMFKGAEKFTFSLMGGFESQPAVFGENENGVKIQQSSRSFNTFEIGPSVKIELPGLFPMAQTKYFKGQRAKTILSTAYNYQNRTDFTREIFQMNYSWKFFSPNNRQVFETGLPFMSLIKFVNIKKSDGFQQKIDALNDLFLRNTYSDQFIWQDCKLTYEFKNTATKTKKKTTIYYLGSFDLAGNVLSMFRSIQDTSINGQYQLFGQNYSQFARVDNQFNFSLPIAKTRSLHLRALAGAGLPYGNSKTSMPYDYSFFAGGANDNRGWRARTLGPGGYKYYLDTNLIQTQVADIRIGGSAEYRFSFGKVMKGAIFVDAGNIWTIREDVKRPGSQFSKDWAKQIAVATGIGFRWDFEFFILRLDLGLPIHNPALPKGSNWVFQSLDNYKKELEAKNFSQTTLDKLSTRLFTPVLSFGIGYPF